MNTNENSAPVDEDAIDVDGMENQAAGGNRLKLLPFKDGTNVYRILPPFGETAKKKGFPFAEIFLHWWKRPTDKVGFPVLCTKKSDPAGCPICDEVERVQALLDKALAPFTTMAGDKKKIAWDRVPDSVKSQSKYVRDIGWQRHYYYNAVSTAGEVGVLKLPKTLGDKLNALIRKCVKDRKFNPVSRKEGVYFLLTRVKTNAGRYDFEADFKKQVVKLEDGDTAEKIVRGPLPEEILNKLESSMKDLYNLFKPQTAETLRKVMTKKAKDDSKFSPDDYSDEEAGPASGSSDKAESVSMNDEDDIQEPSDDTVDALADELGLGKS